MKVCSTVWSLKQSSVLCSVQISLGESTSIHPLPSQIWDLKNTKSFLIMYSVSAWEMLVHLTHLNNFMTISSNSTRGVFISFLFSQHRIIFYSCELTWDIESPKKNSIKSFELPYPVHYKMQGCIHYTLMIHLCTHHVHLQIGGHNHQPGHLIQARLDEFTGKL